MAGPGSVPGGGVGSSASGGVVGGGASPVAGAPEVAGAVAPPWTLELLNAIGEGVGLVHETGELMWANELMWNVDAATRSTLLQQCKDALPGLKTDAAQGQGSPRTFRITSADDARHFEAQVTLLNPRTPGVLGGQPRMVLVVRDVSADRRMQQKMDAIDSAGRELMRLDAEVVRTMNQMERLKLLEDRIVRSCRELLHFDHFIIRLLDERNKKLELVMSYGVPQEIVDAIEIYAFPERNGISGYVAATGKSYICNDVSADDLFLPGLLDAKSSLTVPLRLNDKVIGIMDVESQQPSAFNDRDRQFAEIFGRYVAMSLNMLGLLVAERVQVNEAVSERVEDEITEPLTDIQHEVDVLKKLASHDPEVARHVERIMQDVEAIRRRVRECTSGPQTLLGVDRVMQKSVSDPILAGRRVLVADDEQKVRRIIGDVLRHYGCDTVVCENGTEAIRQLEASKEGRAPKVDLVISDIRMPDFNGFEVFSAAKRLGNAPPVILMTGFGYDPHHSIVRASQDGLQGVLFKPFQVERLLDEVRKAMAPR
jgi:CheY-like chemotaxis protein